MKMKFLLLLSAVSLFLTGCSTNNSSTWIFLLLGTLTLLLGILRVYSSVKYSKSRKRKRHRKPESLDQILLIVIIFMLALVFLLAAAVCEKSSGSKAPEATNPVPQVTEPKNSDPTEPDETTPATTPGKTASTDPKNWGIQWDVYVNDQKVSNYQRENPISFGAPEDYFTLPGIATFRGNNYRNNPAYGTASVTEKTLTKKWAVTTGAIAGGRWAGCGWTGQPLIVQWDVQTRNNMNLYPAKKAKDNLVEVIYATLDGKIYFMDLEDGKATRDPMTWVCASRAQVAWIPEAIHFCMLALAMPTLLAKSPGCSSSALLMARCSTNTATTTPSPCAKITKAGLPSTPLPWYTPRRTP